MDEQKSEWSGVSECNAPYIRIHPSKSLEILKGVLESTRGISPMLGASFAELILAELAATARQ